MLLDIKNVFAKAKYLGTADNHKGIPHLIQSHIFEIEVRGEKADEKKEHIAQYWRWNCILYAAGAVCLLQVTQ